MLSKKFKSALLATASILTVVSLYVIFTADVLSLSDVIFTPLAWTLDLPTEYYVLSASWVNENPALKEIVDQANQSPVSKTGLKDLVSQQLRDPDGQFLKSVEDDIRKQHTAEFTLALKKELEDSLRQDATGFQFSQDVKSFKVEEQLRAQYLAENGQLLKNEIIRDFLSNTTDETLRSKIENLDSLGVDRKNYFQNIFDTISKNYMASGAGVLTKGKPVFSNGLKEVTVPPKSKTELTKRRVKIKPQDFRDLQEKHDGCVAFLRSLSVPPMEVYSGDGIVLAAGKTHIIGALNVLIQLRDMGSELPVELVLDAKSDYDQRLCETLLPSLGGKCLVIEEILGPELYANLKPSGFPLKIISIVVSSFDNTIYLDSDTFPIKNVDTLLESEPFLKKKFILWPDNWHKGTSPLFYEIIRLVPGEPVRRNGLPNEDSFASYIARDKDSEILFHDLDGIPPFTSIESGQLVFSKREHFRSLLLTLYYNLNGDSFYYPLLFQGVFGVGDRETFVPALHVMDEPYYITDWEIKFTGLEREKDDEPGEFYFDESTMVQRDPHSAMKFHNSWRAWLAGQGLDTRFDPFQNGEYTSNLVKKFFEENQDIHEPDPFFLHVHSPKINSVFNEVTDKAKYDYSSRYITNVGEHTDLLGTTDWELKFHTINTWSTCEGMVSEAFWSSVDLDQQEVCKKMRGYVKKLKKGSNDAKAVNVRVLSEMEKLML
ncbi:hypothetical protein JCM33374_g4218 [Metschnikowia sp. JCM 33374]|nr:hypothetical protein JCM33374_g4218 [Metschnikowia sp. JCM 33374]